MTCNRELQKPFEIQRIPYRKLRWIFAIFIYVAKDIEKYKAQNLQIAGFAMLSPLAKLLLTLPYIEFKNINIRTFIYFIISLLLFIIGITFIFRGVVLLKEDR